LQKKLFICSNKFSFLLSKYIMISDPCASRPPPAASAASASIFSLEVLSQVPSQVPDFETINNLVSLRVDNTTIASVAITQVSEGNILFAFVQQRTNPMQITCADVVEWFTATFRGADITFAVAPNAIMPRELIYRVLNLA
jgi:hypothetical protein